MLFPIPPRAPVTVWFDGGCPLCRRENAGIQRLGRAGQIDVAEGAPASCPRDRPDLLAWFHAREGDRMLSSVAAFADIWRAISVLRRMGLLARNRLELTGLELAYRQFLRLRPRPQRLALRLERA